MRRALAFWALVALALPRACRLTEVPDADGYIPLVDIAPFLAPNATRESQLRVAREWGRALEAFGFAAIVGHGVAPEAQEALFAAAAAFFARPSAAKLAAMAPGGYGTFGGYTPPGVESVARSSRDGSRRSAPPDLVENVVFLPGMLPAAGGARTIATDTGTGSDAAGAASNDPLASLAGPAGAYWGQMSGLVGCLHELSALALGLKDPGYFDAFYAQHPSFALRLAHYPPLQSGEDAGEASTCRGARGEAAAAAAPEACAECDDEDRSGGAVRYGAHTDYQGFTVLRPDPTRPGLEVLKPKPWGQRGGGWAGGAGSGAVAGADACDEGEGQAWVPVREDAVAAAGALLVNLGDLWQHWTNDKWPATCHRVANPPAGSDHARHPRLSLVFFTGPRADAVVAPLDACVDSEHPARYAPVVSGDHLRAKVAASNV